MKNKLEGRVVILGASGFLGAKIEEQARNKGWDVLGLSSSDIDLHESDAEQKLLKVLKDGDTLIFSAGKVPAHESRTLSRNLEMAQRVHNVCSHVNLYQFVLISSDAVYGSSSGLFSESSLCVPDSLHGLMSLSKETLFCSVNSQIKTVIRPVAIYGNGDPHKAYGANRFLKQAMNEKKITIFGEGTSIRDHIFVEDVARIVNETISTRFSGILNTASGISYSFRALAEIVRSLSPQQISFEKFGNESTPTFKYYDISKLTKVMPGIQVSGAKEGLLKMLN